MIAVAVCGCGGATHGQGARSSEDRTWSSADVTVSGDGVRIVLKAWNEHRTGRYLGGSNMGGHHDLPHPEIIVTPRGPIAEAQVWLDFADAGGTGEHLLGTSDQQGVLMVPWEHVRGYVPATQSTAMLRAGPDRGRVKLVDLYPWREYLAQP